MSTNNRIKEFVDRLRFDGPAPTPGLSAESASSLSTDQIIARQRAAKVRGLAARVGAHAPMTEDEREQAVGIVPGRKQNRPTKARKVSEKPARKIPGAGQPGIVIPLGSKKSEPDGRRPDRFAAARFAAARPEGFTVDEWALVQRALRKEQARDRAAAAIEQLTHASLREIR